jgi:hypothetical protein
VAESCLVELGFSLDGDEASGFAAVLWFSYSQVVEYKESGTGEGAARGSRCGKSELKEVFPSCWSSVAGWLSWASNRILGLQTILMLPPVVWALGSQANTCLFELQNFSMCPGFRHRWHLTRFRQARPEWE